MNLVKEQFKGGRGISGGKSMSNGGIGGSGIFGIIGTTVQCPASDNSYYCNFMKLIQVIMTISIILYVIYLFFPSMFNWKSKR